MPLARFHARRFAGRGEPIEDLTQVAALALIRAVDRFDPARGVPFARYASPSIVGALKRHFRDHTWTIHVPRSLQERGVRVRAVAAEMVHELRRSPTTSELAARTGLTSEAVVEALGVVHAYSPGQIDDRATTAAETVRDSFDDVDEWAAVAPLLRALSAQDRALLEARFGRNMTQDAIAAELGVSQMQVSRLLARALSRLRGTDERPTQTA